MKINGGVFERYYGFEPDSYNFQLLNKFIDGLPLDIRKRSEIFNAAVYDECGTETFYSLKGPGSFMADIETKVSIQ